MNSKKGMSFNKNASLMFLLTYLITSNLVYGDELANNKDKKTKDTSTTLDAVTVTDKATFNPPNQKLQLDTESSTGSRLGLTPRETPASITIVDR